MFPPHRTGETARAGRVVGWSEWGDPQGWPVVFCTGAAMTSSMGFTDRATERVICIDRAGLGRSDPDPEKSFVSWTEDAGAVLAAIGVTKPAVIGFSQGGPFALALAGAGLACRVALVAAQDELAHPALRPRLAPEIARMVDAIGSDRRSFEANLAGRADAQGMFDLVLALSSQHDRARYAQPAFAAAYRGTLEHAFARGPGGYVRDLVLAMSPWPIAPEWVETPVTLWYGELDTSPVHSPDFGETLARRLPHATRHVLPDEGGSILWTRAREILEDLAAH
jgi:pimeloyl-ACP methyl ester carboxylesterase